MAAAEDDIIQGYTPANYISYTDEPEYRCHLAVVTSVDAPASVCFDLWNDWERLVDWMDLVAQVLAAQKFD
jgi:uncharacterized membrane protein